MKQSKQAKRFIERLAKKHNIDVYAEGAELKLVNGVLSLRLDIINTGANTVVVKKYYRDESSPAGGFTYDVGIITYWIDEGQLIPIELETPQSTPSSYIFAQVTDGVIEGIEDLQNAFAKYTNRIIAFLESVEWQRF